MSTYYYRDGTLYATKVMCNGKVTWQAECRVYPDEMRREGIGRVIRGLPKGTSFLPWDELMRGPSS